MRRAAALKPKRHLGLSLLVIVVGLFFFLPLVAMARTSFQSVFGSKLGWDNLFVRWSFTPLTEAFKDDAIRNALWFSAKLVAGTVVLNTLILLPTAMWAHLRTPKLRPLIEGITLLPWIVPPIALVVGIRPAFRAAPWFLGSQWSLVPFYVILAMPFTYRSLDAGLRALDLRTMVDASKSLGAGWWRTIFSVIMPNITSALIGASFLTATVVLGEYTIASLLLKNTLPAELVTYNGSHARGGTAVALALLFLTSFVLIIFTKVLRRRGLRIETAASA